MTSIRPAGRTGDSMDEEALAGYLDAYPDFFERHPQLLLRLRLPHSHGGATVSLIEKQVEVLREKTRQLERRLAEFVEVAQKATVLNRGARSLRINRMLTFPMESDPCHQRARSDAPYQKPSGRSGDRPDGVQKEFLRVTNWAVAPRGACAKAEPCSPQTAART